MKLTGWKRDWTLMSAFFDGEEIASINEKLKNLKIENLAFCSFENRFAKAGGLAAVTTNILPYLKETNNLGSVVLLTPYYTNIISSSRVRTTGIRFGVSFNNRTVQVEIYEYRWRYKDPVRGSLKEYYLKAKGFFDAQGRQRDPYCYNEQGGNNNASALSRNSLIFSLAVPHALNALGIRKNIVFHLHEWQTALISLTAKEAMLNGTLESCGTVQTIHNSFDSAISWELLMGITDGSRRKKLAEFPGEELTAYQIGLQLVDAPITTVSNNFAKEFTKDILMTEHFAPHLQNIFRKSGVYGVNNGTFVRFSDKYPKKEKHTIDEVHRIKLKNRKSLLRVLSRYKPDERFGELTYKGGTITKLPDNVPIILMSGRLDPLQKGYDIMLRAVERFMEDEIKVILTPMPAQPSDLDYFYEVACKCKGNLTVFPMKMGRGYQELQEGATFGVMPSIYEPFGAAVEYMASGTVNIGRSTGGLVDQISKDCGFLYREDAVFYTLDNITDFIESDNIVQMRKTNPWAQNMADNLYDVLKKAINVYLHQPDRYYSMILKGFEKAGHFSWGVNAKKYYQVYDMIRS
jgi:glycogen synthase